jgi:hypothetical protein
MEETPDNTTGAQEQGTSSGNKKKPSRDAPELERSPPPSPQLLHPKHLELIFEMRSLVEDQAFSALRLS